MMDAIVKQKESGPRISKLKNPAGLYSDIISIIQFSKAIPLQLCDVKLSVLQQNIVRFNEEPEVMRQLVSEAREAMESAAQRG